MTDQELVNKMVSREQVMVVVGASRDKSKWGNKMVRKLVASGYRVVPVNPNTQQVENLACFATIGQAIGAYGLRPERITVVTVVPATVTLEILEECAQLGVRMVWMQPGSESFQAEQLAREKEIEVVSGSCLVIDGLGQAWEE